MTHSHADVLSARVPYAGEPWNFIRLPGSLTAVSCRCAANPGDGMSWSLPTPALSDLAWRIYHAGYQPDERELYALLSVVSSFQALILRPVRRQRDLLRAFALLLKAEISIHNRNE